MTFDLDTVRMRLSSIRKEFEIPANDREISELCVPRAFISATFGGNPQVTFPTPGPKFLNVHHMDDFMFLNLNISQWRRDSQEKRAYGSMSD